MGGRKNEKLNKRSGAAGFLCAAALFLGTGVLALGTSAFNALAAEVSGQITSCKITDDKQNVEIALNSSGSTEGTDGKVYVFEQPTYRMIWEAAATILLRQMHPAPLPLPFLLTKEMVPTVFTANLCWQ